MVKAMSSTTHSELAKRREIEDELLALGEERSRLTQDDSWNRERVRRLVGPAREAGIKVRDIARLSGLSTQTLHTWMADLMYCAPSLSRILSVVLRVLSIERLPALFVRTQMLRPGFKREHQRPL